MKRVLLSLGLSVVVVLAAGSVRAADSGAKAAIDRLNHDFVAAWNAHDAKKMAAVWAEDGDIVNPFGRKASGRAEVEKLFQDEQSAVMKASTFTMKSASVREIDRDCVFGDWEILLTGMMDPNGNPLPPGQFHSAVVYARAAGTGKWSIVAGRAYAFLPPPGQPAK